MRSSPFSFLSALAFIAVLLGSVPAITSENKPTGEGTLQLFGKYTVAHACPITDNYVLTAAHVVDIRWFDKDFPLVPYRYSNQRGDYGVANPRGTLTTVDIGWLQISSPISVVYRVADNAPEVGDKVFWMEYDLKNKKNAFELKFKDAKVIRVFAGHIIFDEAPESGASGGCLFNMEEEVVGIVVASWSITGWSYGSDYNTGSAVGVWGDWKPVPPEEKDGKESQ